jgi:hypothetical protein
MTDKELAKIKAELQEEANKFKRLGWEPWQIDLLKMFYGKVKDDAIAKRVGKNRRTVAEKARSFGLSKSKLTP